jgi:hypothetical protein
MPRVAIASSSLRRWPTEVTPMLIRSSAVSFGSTSASIIIIAERRYLALKPQILQPRRYVHAVVLGSEKRQPASGL